MVKLENHNISLQIDLSYGYSDITDTDEYGYCLSLYANNEPIIYIPNYTPISKDYLNGNSSIIDFELDDERLSETFLSAINNKAKVVIGRTYEGTFDLSVEPYEYMHDKSDEWMISVDLYSLFYGPSFPKRLEMNFKFYVSYEDLLKFTNELAELEQRKFDEYVQKYGRERYR